jgi:hypothetical protein
MLAKEMMLPWVFATSEDVRYPGAKGAELSAGTREMHWYLDRVIARSVRSTAVRLTLLKVLHMLAHPWVLFRPGIPAPILLEALRESAGYSMYRTSEDGVG